jgi:hypothetical protein
MPDDVMLQIADVILAEHRVPADALRWTVRTLRKYPGCVAAVGLDVNRRWIVAHVRDIGGEVWRAS